MKKTKVGPNEPCPCGSGRKFKKCCNAPGVGLIASDVPHTQSDRAFALEKLDHFIDECTPQEEREYASEEFWGRFCARKDELSSSYLEMSRSAEETWFSFDYRLEDGLRIVDHVLRHAELSAGERAFLTAMQRSTMRLYEVQETIPGSAITLRDVIEGDIVTVRERSASRTVSRSDILAARVIPRGASGKPELEAGLFAMTMHSFPKFLDTVRTYRDAYFELHPGEPIDAFYELLPPLVHDAWLTAIFEPETPDLGPTEDEEITRTETMDPNLANAVVLRDHAIHYRGWIDEAIPALKGQTPRAAAKRRDLRANVEQMLRELEASYERALRDKSSPYDPTWMWAELGLEPAMDPSRPPPLAHERIAEYVRQRGAAPSSDSVESGGHYEALADFDCHHGKLYWVDASLSYLLALTDVDVAGYELRSPSPSFALVFTDRHALALGERLLARNLDDPLCAKVLRVFIAYVTEHSGERGRQLDITLAFDGLGAELPSLIRHQVPMEGDRSLRAFVDGLGCESTSAHDVGDFGPERGLLRLVLNAVLYATSAGACAEETRLAAPRTGSVCVLSGTIDGRRIRELQELGRAPEGPAILSRFLVHGHWRRPAKTLADQRLRWIEPYWKGPDLTAVIEKAYRTRS